MAATAGLVELDALGPSGSYRAHERQLIADVRGTPVAELSLVPPLFVTRALAALRRADVLPVELRLAAIAQAGAAHARGTVDGVTAAQHHHLVSGVSGMPIATVRAAADGVARSAAEAYHSVQHARPVGAVDDWRDPLTRTGRGVWTRRGDVFAVHAPGNHPGVHALWLEALALGYRVAVRPSRRDPFTPHRLISALREAGLGDDHVVLLPTGHEGAQDMLRAADLAMAYGGDEVMQAVAAYPRTLPQGPGRSKILITGEVDWREHLDVIVESIASQGGRACVNATAVLVEGDAAPLARAVAEQLAAFPSLPPEHPGSVLPVLPVDDARSVERYLAARAQGTVPWLGGGGVVDELGDGSAALRPAVHELDRPDAEQAGIELPFPCVWIAPWTRDAGLAPFEDTLVLTAMTGDAGLVGALVGEPTISNVYVGDHPTDWIEPGIPHDGYLADFLMRTKAVIRG